MGYIEESYTGHFFIFLSGCRSTFLFLDANLKTLPLIDFKLDRVKGQYTTLF